MAVDLVVVTPAQAKEILQRIEQGEAQAFKLWTAERGVNKGVRWEGGVFPGDEGQAVSQEALEQEEGRSSRDGPGGA